MQVPEGYYLLPKDAVASIVGIFDAAAEAIQEIIAKATRGQDDAELGSTVEAFYRLHNAVVHGDELDEIF